MMRRVVALALLLAIAIAHTACMTPPRPIASPRTYIPLRRPERVWLTDKEGDRFQVLRPRALGDTLFGRTITGDEVWIAFSDVPRIEARTMDKTKTYGLIGGSIVAGVLIIALMSGSGSGLDQDELDRPEMSVILFRR
jgi:hypothetical protein